MSAGIDLEGFIRAELARRRRAFGPGARGRQLRGRGGPSRPPRWPPGVASSRFELELPHTDHVPRMARQCLAEWLAPDLVDPELGDAKLLTGELVTNALVHGRGTIELRAQLGDDRLIVEVIDQGTGFTPIVQDRDLDSGGGWGLRLVDEIASHWGVHAGASHVWFELERGRPV